MEWPDVSGTGYKIASAVTSYQRLLDELRAAEKLSKLLQDASDHAFKLAQTMRCVTGSGELSQERLEKFLPRLVRRFRRAWEEARREARKLPVWVYGMLEVPGNSYLYPCCHLNTNPTEISQVDAMNLEWPAGWLGCTSRIIRRNAPIMRDIIRQHLGASDPDRLARDLAAEHKFPLVEVAKIIAKTVRLDDLPGGPVDEAKLPEEWLVMEDAATIAGRWRKQKSRQATKPASLSKAPAKQSHNDKERSRR